MSNGIYCYIDKKDNSIVYIGKDSNIHRNKRHKAHIDPNRYNEQQKIISSQDIFKLKQKVESKNFEWKIIDLNKAIKTIKGVYDLDL